MSDRPELKTRFFASFQPEAWSNDCSIPVDPEGPTEWDCTRFLEEKDLISHLEDIAPEDLDEGVIDTDDRLLADPDAPEWIRRWTGPFTIRIRRQTAVG